MKGMELSSCGGRKTVFHGDFITKGTLGQVYSSHIIYTSLDTYLRSSSDHLPATKLSGRFLYSPTRLRTML